jgi:hypothetical protein
VTDLRVGVDGSPPSSVSKVVDLGSESDVFTANLKLDAWILPFLNVYTLLGYVYNESKTNVHVTIPAAGGGTREFDMNVNTNLDGFVGGGGLTLATGYDDFFMVIDSNYSQTDIGFDDTFQAITASMRAGYQATLGQKSCSSGWAAPTGHREHRQGDHGRRGVWGASSSRPTRDLCIPGSSTSAATFASRAASSSPSTWPSTCTAAPSSRSRRCFRF